MSYITTFTRTHIYVLIGGIEVYDIRKTVDPTDALLDVLSDYLNKPDVRI